MDVEPASYAETWYHFVQKYTNINQANSKVKKIKLYVIFLQEESVTEFCLLCCIQLRLLSN